MRSKLWRRNPLRPAWIVGIDELEAATHGEGRLFAIRRPTKESIRVAEVDWRSGTLHWLTDGVQPVVPTLDVGSALFAATRLYVNCGDHVVGYDARGNAHCHQYPRIEGATLVGRPHVHEGMLLCLWELPDGSGARASTTSIDAPGSLRSSAILEGDAYHPILVAGDTVIVPMRAAHEGNAVVVPTSSESRLHLLDVGTMRVLGCSAIPAIHGDRESVLFARRLFFYGNQRGIQTRPEGEIVELPPTGASTNGGSRTTMQESGSQVLSWLNCYSMQERKLIKSWRLGGDCEGLTWMPGHPGLVITTDPGIFQTSVEMLVNSRPRPTPIGSWEGSVVGRPEFAGARCYWLTDLASLSWLERETGNQSTDPQHDTQLRIIDFATGEHRVVALTLGERAASLILPGDFAVIRTPTRLIAYARDDLWNAGQAVGAEHLSRVTRALQFSGASESLNGALFSGPVQEEWGYEFENALLHELVDDLLESPAAFWDGSASHRLTAIDAMSQEIARLVLTYWPDTYRAQAISCPDEFISAARLVDPGANIPFGQLAADRRLGSRILAWRQQAEVTDMTLPPATAERVARFLLHEHIRRCINELPSRAAIGRWRDQRLLEWRSAGSLPPALMAALAWYSLDQLEPSVVGRFIETFTSRWPQGAPLWEGDVGPYIEFLQDCARWGLLCRPARDSLAEAVSRAWCTSLNPRRSSVFISYSHYQEGLARRLAEGLRDRGLRVSLDRWEKDSDSGDLAIETWIAETVLGAETKVFIVSADALASGWVNREIEWEVRLLGVRRSVSLPFIVVAGEDSPLSLDAYPRGKVCHAADVEQRFDDAVDELAMRIVLDGILQLQTARDGRIALDLRA